MLAAERFLRDVIEEYGNIQYQQKEAIPGIRKHAYSWNPTTIFIPLISLIWRTMQYLRERTDNLTLFLCRKRRNTN